MWPLTAFAAIAAFSGGAVIGSGTGKTGNISSGGVLFRTEDQLAAGPAVELSIRWPTVSESAPFVELRMFGRIVRSDANGTAVEMRRYHFQQPGNAVAAVDQAFGGVMIQ
jgi:hypothetical protein